MTFVGVYQFVLPLLQGSDTKPMTGDLKVAVAGFRGTGAPGADDATAREFSDSVYRTLATALRPQRLAEAGIDVTLRKPSELGAVEGDSAAARAAHARELATEHKANLVVYGTLGRQAELTTLRPEFWLDPERLHHPEDGQQVMNALTVPDEPTGAQSLGELRVRGNIDTQALARRALRRQLEQRTRGLAVFMLGLEHYAQALAETSGSPAEARSLAAAERSFSQAARPGAWDPRAGGIVELFLGNVALTQRRLAVAAVHYGRALRIDARDARAALGAAETRYHQAARGCRRRARVAGVRRALRAYSQVLEEARAPLLVAKAGFGAGRAGLCLAVAHASADLDAAETRFEAVIATFEGGYEPARGLASQAHGGLGLIHIVRGRLRQATIEYESAVRLSDDPVVRAAFHATLGYLYANLGDEDAARRNYRRAIALNPKERAEYVEDMKAWLR